MKAILIPQLLCSVLGLANAGEALLYPAPAGEEISKAYKVQVDGRDTPVYVAKVAPKDPAGRWKAMDDKTNSANYFDKAAFAYFDVDEPVRVTVTCPDLIELAKVLPSSYQISPAITGRSLTFTMSKGKQVTLEVNGNWVGSLHLFANPRESNVPKPGDANVIYFGPGVHELTHLVVSNNQTVYVAGGAVVRGVIGADERFGISGYSGLRTYSPTLLLRGTNITLRGRGIIDGGHSTTHARHLVQVEGKDIRLEGVVLRDSSTWTVPIRRSDRVKVENVKLLGYRANSDGIDICNSRDIAVKGCFIRTLDDLIVIKTDKGQGKSRGIVAQDCVLWNEVAHALSVGAELREDVEDVVFKNCDVIRDKGREWSLRIYHSDSARISNVRFEDIRIEETSRLISLWINKAFWSRDGDRGHISDVVFDNISAVGSPLRIELQGFDSAHCIENVRFSDVRVNGNKLSAGDIKTNAFIKNVTVTP